jgi:hypothetical protein
MLRRVALVIMLNSRRRENLIFLRAVWNGILSSQRRNGVMSSKVPYMEHLLTGLEANNAEELCQELYW